MRGASAFAKRKEMEGGEGGRRMEDSVLRPAYELSVRLTAMNLVDAIDVALTGIGGEVTGVSRAKILSLRAKQLVTNLGRGRTSDIKFSLIPKGKDSGGKLARAIHPPKSRGLRELYFPFFLLPYPTAVAPLCPFRSLRDSSELPGS
uniref:Uncharacterized protein n=1 Tax=Vespula pensylvanica TaxID=30213 RepID=A0A834JH42_VESPE|nr:hypothetical protein H0235_018288 [Vespula pensylvanica]